jgi:hypothetical protein
MNVTVKKKVNFVNSSQHGGSSPSGIALSFDGFGTLFGFHPTATSLKRLEKSKCASGASKLLTY